ncbi:hypothetical protein AB0P12_27305 [Streptomyces subrutilus]|uniref:Uncharacterized protein n=1 Tax=Streptomyces subrutilus TaxID=36818 RepID=A0A918RG76_9ACTN|nr:hypothetical protein [Streptomyces subrutilus]WSJ28284.1 hypothetical protein OG479_02670 [Streptomyces subrutilus]GGZ95549.1 hypothetical protein GCM10010371_64460 [Streptomyces subrutilus]
MAGLLAKLKDFRRTPQGARAEASVRRAAADPRKRAQAMRFVDRLRRR